MLGETLGDVNGISHFHLVVIPANKDLLPVKPGCIEGASVITVLVSLNSTLVHGQIFVIENFNISDEKVVTVLAFGLVK